MKDLSVNLDKIKVTIFNTAQAMELEFYLEEENVACTSSYTFQGVTFRGPRVSLQEHVFA